MFSKEAGKLSSEGKFIVLTSDIMWERIHSRVWYCCLLFYLYDQITQLCEQVIKRRKLYLFSSNAIVCLCQKPCKSFKVTWSHKSVLCLESKGRTLSLLERTFLFLLNPWKSSKREIDPFTDALNSYLRK